jgi:glycolate oxidase FAD binding subunit
VVKNAAGYNIPRLLAGSLGTLGVITEVTLMVRPLPQCSALVLCDAADFETAECLLVALNRSRTFPVAVELLAGRCRPGCPWGDMPGDAVARLIVGFDGSEPEVEWMLHRLCDEWRAAGARCLAGLRGDHAVTAWNWLAEAFGQVQINVLPSALVGVTEELIGGLPGISLQAHAGNGAIRVELPSAASRAGRLAADPFATLVRHRLRPVAADAGGHLLVLAYPDDAELTAADIWGPLCDGEAVMRRIRERFDPAGILNPGRFVFGT